MVDVEAVVLAVVDRVAAPERRVEDRRCDLTDAAADAGHEQAVLDRLALEEAPLGGARADGLVERELRAGLDLVAVQDVGHQVDVDDAVRRRHAHVGGRVADHPRDAERLRLLRREGGLRERERDARRAPGRARLQAGRRQAARGQRGVQLDPAVRVEHRDRHVRVRLELRVDRRLERRALDAIEQRAHLGGVERDPDRVGVRLGRQQRCELRGLQRRPRSRRCARRRSAPTAGGRRAPSRGRRRRS